MHDEDVAEAQLREQKQQKHRAEQHKKEKLSRGPCVDEDEMSIMKVDARTYGEKAGFSYIIQCLQDKGSNPFTLFFPWMHNGIKFPALLPVLPIGTAWENGRYQFGHEAQIMTGCPKDTFGAFFTVGLQGVTEVKTVFARYAHSNNRLSAEGEFECEF